MASLTASTSIARLAQGPCTVAPRPRVIRHQRLVAASFSLQEKLKHALDFGKKDRVAVIHKMYYGNNGTPSRQVRWHTTVVSPGNAHHAACMVHLIA